MKCQEQVVFYSGGSRPSGGGWGRGGAGDGLKNICFRPFRPQFRLEIRGKGMGGRERGRAPPLDPPLFNVFINCLRLGCCASFS